MHIRERRAWFLLDDGDLLLPKTVLLELDWILRAVANQLRAKAIACLKHLTGSPGVTIEDRSQVEAARMLRIKASISRRHFTMPQAQGAR